MGKSALITGGARRIGKGIALSLAAMGYDIALHYNSSQEDAQKTAFEVKTLGVQCKIYKCDLSNEQETLSLIPQVVKKFPDLLLLINNASVFERAPFMETEPELLDRAVAINFKAPYFLSQAFAKVCKKGQIINMLDTKIAHSDHFYSAYSLSKKALAEFTRMSARELAPDILVNAIAPGMILPPVDKTEEYMDNRAKNIPVKKRGRISCITKSIRYLIENDFITGQLIFVDGGESL